MLSLLAAVTLVMLTNGTPTCQYGIMGNGPIIYPMNECNGDINGYTNVNTSYQFVCNSTANGINLLYYQDGDCSGQSYATDVTSDFSEFNCSLPQCNDNDNAFMEITQYQNCTTKIGARTNIFTNECMWLDIDKTGIYTCNDSPPSFTIHEYQNRDCSGNPHESITFKDGCNYNATKYYIEKCTKPTNSSSLKL